MRRRKSHHLKIQIRPTGIAFFDKPDLPFAPPTLELFLEVDGVGDLAEPAVEHQSIEVVPLGEAQDFALCWAMRRSRLLVTPV